MLADLSELVRIDSQRGKQKRGCLPLINIEKGRFVKAFSAEFEDNGALPKVISLKSGAKVNVIPQKAEAVAV